MKPLSPAWSALTAILGPAAAKCSTATPTVTLDSGPIFGLSTTLPNALSPVHKFMGVPFAAPPERFSLPKRPKSWTYPKNTTVFGPSCLQYFGPINSGPTDDVLTGVFNVKGPPESEDCLYINVFTPSDPAPNGGRPVMLFIPGGGWQLGNGLLDLSGFAGYEDIIAMSFNYRTNIFGWPDSPDIPLEERNLGLYDQRLALEWVQSNAAAFGGDPKKVTIWGESAGSMSVDVHMQAYAKSHHPPFRGAIMSSGQLSFGPLMDEIHVNDGGSSWANLTNALGCEGHDQLKCMRKLPAQTLYDAMNETGAYFFPQVDNKTIPTNRAAAWRKGNVAKVPVLTSTVAQEGRALIDHDITLPVFIETYLPEPFVTKKQRDAIMTSYKKQPNIENDFDLASAIYTDLYWKCPQGILANASASNDIPTWRFDYNASITDLLPPDFSWVGKFHGSDVSLIFFAPSFEGKPYGLQLTPQIYSFANYYRGMISRFVKNPAGGPGWPAVGSAYKPFDVAALGDVGDARTGGAAPVNETVLDDACALFGDIYDVVEKYFS